MTRFSCRCFQSKVSRAQEHIKHGKTAHLGSSTSNSSAEPWTNSLLMKAPIGCSYFTPFGSVSVVDDMAIRSCVRFKRRDAVWFKLQAR